MIDAAKDAIHSALGRLDIAVTHKSKFRRLQQLEKDLKEVLKWSSEKLSRLAGLMDKSKGQLRQDLFVLSQLDFKQQGFFVEFGATNGYDLSNSHLLEKEFGWQGIVAEPAKCWHSQLAANRNCKIEHLCVWASTGENLQFNETREAEFSTINKYAADDLHKNSRVGAAQYEVKTISLNDMLEKHEAPKRIDYLSIDTEGSELEILSAFDFSKHNFSVITVEHNFTPKRDKIHSLLASHGYVRIFEGLSNWDDWYISSELQSAKRSEKK